MNSNDDLDESKLSVDLNNEYLTLKEQLNVSFNKFINAEIKNIDLINQIFSILNNEQKILLISKFNKFL